MSRRVGNTCLFSFDLGAGSFLTLGPYFLWLGGAVFSKRISLEPPSRFTGSTEKGIGSSKRKEGAEKRKGRGRGWPRKSTLGLKIYSKLARKPRFAGFLARYRVGGYFCAKKIRWENYMHVKLLFPKVSAVRISFVLILLHTRDFRRKISAKRKNSIFFEMFVGILVKVWRCTLR